MKRFLVVCLLLGSINLKAQEQTSPNLIGSHNLSGVTVTTSTGGGAGAGAGGNTPGYNSSTNTIMFGYTNGNAAYTYAFSQALQNSGMSITGYNYYWEYMNQGFTRGSLTANVNFLGTSGLSLHSRNWTLGTTTDWTTISGTEIFVNSLLAANIANFSLTFSGRDDRGWAGYYGPVVRNPSLSLNYTFDACAVNPLSSPTCSGYAAAYLTQQCTANALYDPSCPGYAAAYLTQQCTISALYSPSCPGYAAAYLTYQCNANPLYSTVCSGYEAAYKTQQCTANPLYATDCPGYAAAYKSQQCTADPFYATDCPGYAAAYAKKNILNIGSTTTTTPSTTTSSTVVITSSTSDPVAQAAPLVADTTVNSVVTTKSTTANADANPAAAVKITPAAPAPSTMTATQDTGSKKSNNDINTQNTQENKPADKPKTSREQLAEQRREAAKKEAVAKGKELANEMGKAADMAAQVEIQNVVVQAMGYTPGFDNYGRFILPDAQGYKPYTIYNNQRTVDSPAGRGLFGSSDYAHQQMVDAQYNLGN